jgi:hypothetical protein
MLAKLYGGRRIDALDALLLPEVRDVKAASDESLLATMAGHAPPAFWIAFALPADAPKELASTATADARASHAANHVRLGRLYWRRADFVDAAYDASPGETPESKMILALALALARADVGSAVEMMRAPSPAALGLWHTEPLDVVAQGGGPYAGMAAYDAAYLRSLCPDRDDPAAWMRDVAKRFHDAEAMLTGADQKKAAAAHARDAEEAANAAAKK